MIKNKIVVKPSGTLFKVVSSTAQNWPNKGAFISGDEIKKIIKMGFGVSFKK
jgi:hypothetical protein